MTEQEWFSIDPARRLGFFELILKCDPKLGGQLKELIDATPMRHGRVVITEERAEELNCPFLPEDGLL